MLEQKVKSPRQLKRILQALQRKKNKVVFTNGCFDLLHYGHVKYLEAARKKGDLLVVAVNSDASVKSIKGSRRPVVNARYRARVLAALASVDYVVIFNQSDPLKIIRYLKPDVLVKGADWKRQEIIGRDFVQHHGGKVATIKFVPGFSTTNLLKNIAQAC